MKIIMALLQSFLCLVSLMADPASGFKSDTDRAAVSMTTQTDFTFDSVTADEMKITEEEKQKCADWFADNFLSFGENGKNAAFSFVYGGKPFRFFASEWEFEKPEKTEGKNGAENYTVTAKHKKNGLILRVEGVLYKEKATCEWTVYIRNDTDNKSPVISDFYALDSVLPTGDGEIYFNRGSHDEIDDFTLYKSPCTATGMTFTANGGRSGSFLPYFNICGEDGGCCVAVGWTGQWYTRVSQKDSGAKVRAKQQTFRAYLEAGEEIRSPRISLTFYSGNPLKGYNAFRKWMTDDVVPENVGAMNGFVIANEFSKLKTDDFIKMINNIPQSVLDSTDYFWMDAGWYKYNEAWHDGVGNWIADTDRFPDGLKPLADEINSKCKRFLLWFEPERVRENTALYNEAMKHEGWILKRGDDLLWNLANEDACDYLCRYISDCLNCNGISIYRQDFNFNPLAYWEDADKEFYSHRRGICENRYVTNLYKYLDYLLENTEGLIIDNCASGGRRIDLEMESRSLPLWRSDYNCGNADGSLKENVLEATQAMTYGLSLWIPYSGTNRYFHSQYASRSCILPDQSVYEPDPYEYTAYSEISELMDKTYYPLAPGCTDLAKYLAMQFDDGAGTHGCALIYKREKVTQNTFVLRLNGLAPEKTYVLSNFDDAADTLTATGEKLMNGIEIEITETPKCAIYFYTAAE